MYGEVFAGVGGFVGRTGHDDTGLDPPDEVYIILYESGIETRLKEEPGDLDPDVLCEFIKAILEHERTGHVPNDGPGGGPESMLVIWEGAQGRCDHAKE